MKNASVFPEYWLYWLFQQQHWLRSPLQTTCGKPVDILDTGRENGDNGPDFLDTHLCIDGTCYRGAVEFHLTPEAWFQHGHQEDIRYAHVLLHLVWDAPAGIPTALQDRFPHIILKDQLTIPAGDWIQHMKGLEKHGLRKRQKNHLRDPLQIDNIARYAERRFQRKINRFQEWQGYFSLENCLFISLAEALGYSKNKFPLRQLLWEYPPSRIFQLLPAGQRSPLSIWVFLMYTGGLVATFPRNDAPPEKETLLRWVHYFKTRGIPPVLQENDWYFSRLRPMNSPYLRLAAIAQLLYQYQSPGLFQKLLLAAMDRLPTPETISRWHQILRLKTNSRLAAVLKSTSNFKQIPPHIIGQTRLKQFMVNSLLPLLCIWARQTGSYGFREYLSELYETFPSAEDAGVIRAQLDHIDDAVLAETIRKSAFYQQGLLELMGNRSLLND